MSFAGHAIDAIKRIQYNRSLLLRRRARYHDLKNAVSDIKEKYHPFVDRNQLSSYVLEIYKRKIKRKISIERQKTILISLVVTGIIAVLIYYITTFAYQYFMNQ